MRYINRCPDCHPLGEYGEFDLYFCTSGGGRMLYLKEPDGSEHNSSWPVDPLHCRTIFLPAFLEAEKRTAEAGLIVIS